MSEINLFMLSYSIGRKEEFIAKENLKVHSVINSNINYNLQGSYS